MRYLLTCQKGLEQATKKEITALGYKCRGTNTAIYLDGDLEAIAIINLWSRCGNKLYIVLAEGDCQNFDELYESVYDLERNKFAAEFQHINISAHSYDSALTSIPSIQSISQKAIFKKLQYIYKLQDNLTFDDNLPTLEVRILLISNKVSIMINTSGKSLHKRGYRSQTGIAPINESLAAGIIHMTGRKFSDLLLDPFCGSGTLVIEAAMIAKRIAPGMTRKFAFEDWDWYNDKYLSDAKINAQAKIITEKKYNIYASDNDLAAIETAKQNAIRAGVDDTIMRIHKDMKHWRDNNLLNGNFTIITNPPYGHRIGDINSMDGLYQDLIYICDSSVTSSIITNFASIDNYIGHKRSSTETYNGGIDCKIYMKKS